LKLLYVLTKMYSRRLRVKEHYKSYNRVAYMIAKLNYIVSVTMNLMLLA
jgi:hypothetical protein